MKSLERALHAMSFDPLLSGLLARTPWERVAELAGWLAATDPYSEGAAVARALHAVSGSSLEVRDYLEHQLWCAWREAAWTSGIAEPLTVQVNGASWLEETEGHPTIVVAPMTLARSDALHAIARVNPTGRPSIVFGEDVGDDPRIDGLPEVVSGRSRGMPRRILEVLARQGILYTYPDFVYDGRAVEVIDLFGVRRPVAAGFISLAARHDTMLLPAVCLRSEQGVTLRIEEPVLVHQPDYACPTDESDRREAVARTVAQLIESLIGLAPEQWRLLPTLTFESPQMAGAR